MYNSLVLFASRWHGTGGRTGIMIGRTEEQAALREYLESPRPEFVAVYGRRRVGKTYLIKEFFQEQFSFYATGINRISNRQQLRAFHEALGKYGCTEKKVPIDWFEAFSRLDNTRDSKISA